MMRLLEIIARFTFAIIGLFSLFSVPAAQAKIFSLSPTVCELMRQKGVLLANNPISCQRLRRVQFSYIDFSNQSHTNGQIVVLDALALHVQQIFNELFKRRFPIHQAVPIENYDGNDAQSMAQNNTSAFNGRPITGAKQWSLHAYGAAIDLNPLQNPFIDLDAQGKASIHPIASAKTFVNRLNIRPNKAIRQGMNEEVVELFAQHGFVGWGGYWDYPIDYQHFELASRAFTESLTALSFEKAQVQFEKKLKQYRHCRAQANSVSQEKTRLQCISVFHH